MCLHTTDDDREEIIKKVKRTLINSTNIEDSPEEMKQLYDILFRLDQCGFLERTVKTAEWVEQQSYVVTENGNKPIGEAKLKCSRCGYVSEKFDNYCGGCGYPMENSYKNKEKERLKKEYIVIIEVLKKLEQPDLVTLNLEEKYHVEKIIKEFLKKHTRKICLLGLNKEISELELNE